MRVIVEVKTLVNSSTLQTTRTGYQITETQREIISQFSGQVLPVFLLIKDPDNSASSNPQDSPLIKHIEDEGIYEFTIQLDIKTPQKRLEELAFEYASLFKEYLVNNAGNEIRPVLESNLKLMEDTSVLPHPSEPHSDTGLGPIQDVFESFRLLLTNEEYETLFKEFEALIEEYNSGHYTMCGARAGRTLEFAIYVLAKSWGIDIQKVTPNLLQTASDEVNKLSQELLAYLAEEEVNEKEKYRKNIKNSSNYVINSITSLLTQLDRNPSLTSPKGPMGLEAITNRLYKKYAKNHAIREELHVLNGKKNEIGLIRKIMNIRNDAAHADWSGEPREVSKTTLSAMLDDLRETLFRLVTVGSIIQDAYNLER